MAKKANSVFSKKAKRLFAEYPNKNELFFTVDGMAFWDRNEAEAHAANLKDGTLKTIQK